MPPDRITRDENIEAANELRLIGEERPNRKLHNKLERNRHRTRTMMYNRVKFLLLAAVLMLTCRFIQVTADQLIQQDQFFASSAQKQEVVELEQRNYSQQLGSSSCCSTSATLRLVRDAIHEQPANNEKPFASMLNSAVINGKVSLPCDISLANQDDSVALVLWYKDDSLAPIYTVDARKANSLDKAKILVDDSYSNRAHFDVGARPAHLQLQSVRLEDEGEYRCRVDFKRGRTVNTIISLRVVQPPDEVRIVRPGTGSGSGNNRQQRLEGLIGPFNEGQELVLLCLAQGGKPRPQISWRRDFNVIDDTYQHLDKEGTSNELRIPALNKNHLLSIFTCQATNSNLTGPVQSSITLDLNLKPSEVSLRQLNPQEPLVVGQSVTFECLSLGSRPQATIHWLFQGSRHDTPMNVDQQQTSTRLTLIMQRAFNGQPLTCVAENPRIPSASAMRQTIKLDVHYPPQLSIKLEPPIGTGANQYPPSSSPEDGASSQNLQAAGDEQQAGAYLATGSGREPPHLQEGNDIYLTCQLDANPRPSKPILWRLNGRPLLQQQQLGAGNSNIVMNNQSLVLRKVSRLQSGSYSCEASNQHGASSSQPMELSIKHAPVCSTDDILVFEASVGQTVAVDCNVTANPSKSVHYSWFFASAAGERNLSSWLQRDAALDEQIDESSSRLQFKIKDTSGFGWLKCKAKNEVGLQQRACLFRLAPAQAPSLRHTCRLASAATRSLQLRCEPPAAQDEQLEPELKSEEFELVGHQPTTGSGSLSDHHQPPATGMSRWLDLEAAIRQQQLGADHYRPEVGQMPNLRLVYPPTWLLVELYRWRGGGGSGSKSGPEQLKVSGQPGDQPELVAYVVVGQGQQLANIKSIVEDNHLFSSNPRPVYYVATKPSNSSTSGQQPAAQSIGHRSPQQQPRLLRDPSVQLASSFAFTVPSLEPATSYRLLVYGQNLAPNKSREWTPISGDTLRDESFPPSTRGSPSAASSSLFVAGGDLMTGSSSSGKSDQQSDQSAAERPAAGSSSSASGQQKSIAMRSGGAGESDEPTSGGGLEPASSSTVDRLTAGSGSASSGLVERLHQLGHYRDYAISYAKQKPLLAVPILIAMVVIALLVVVWASSALIALVKRPRKPQSTTSGSLDSSNGLQHRDDQREMQNKGDLPIGKGNSHNQINQLQQAPRRGSTFKSSPEASYDSQNSNSTPSTSHLVNFSNSTGSSSLQMNNNSYDGNNNNIKHHLQCIDPEPCDQRLQNQAAAVYTIGSIDLTGSGHYEASKQRFAAIGYPLQQQPHNFMANSLDRRELQSTAEPIYLTERGSLMNGSGSHSLLGHHQFHHHHNQVTSIDRRLPVAANYHQFAVQEEAAIMRQQQPLLISAPLYLDNGTGSGGLFPPSASTGSQGHSTRNGRGQQRVAFDLSNQQQQQVAAVQHQQLEQAPPSNRKQQPTGKRRILVSPPTQTVDNYSRQSAIQANGSQFNGQCKGSDSGGSNSGNTADSGHESPATTGETTSQLSYSHHTSGNGSGQHLRLRHAPNCPVHSDPRLPATTPAASGHFYGSCGEGHGQLIECCDPIELTASTTGQSHQTGNLLMLMELSPGSEESSTQLQSVDSFANDQQQPVSSVRYQLKNNHQMATSFATTSTTATGNSDCRLILPSPQVGDTNQVESRDMDNWL